MLRKVASEDGVQTLSDESRLVATWYYNRNCCFFTHGCCVVLLRQLASRSALFSCCQTIPEAVSSNVLRQNRQMQLEPAFAAAGRSSRRAQMHIHPTCLPGLPRINAKSGTQRVTTAP